MATLQMKIDSVHAEFLSGNAVSTTVTDNSVVSRDSNGGIWATKLTSLNLGLTHGIPTTDRTEDTVFYSSNADTIYKNTAAGMRVSLGLENSATIEATSTNAASKIVVRDTNGDFSAGVIDADGSALSDLNASNLTSGTISSHRLSLTAGDIPDLNASKITAGALGTDRIPDLNASKITGGEFNTDRIPSLSAGKITSDTFHVNRIPSLSANKITTDTFDAARIPTLNQDTTGSAAYASNAGQLDGYGPTQFLRKDTGQTVNAGVTYTWSATNTPGLQFVNASYSGYSLEIGGWTSSNSNNISRIRNSSGDLHIDSAANGHLYLNHYSGGACYITTNTYNSGAFECDGRIYADNGCHIRGDWLRINGNAGVYWETHQGGWYMKDSTWIRIDNGKNLWCNNGIMATNYRCGVGTSGPAVPLHVYGTGASLNWGNFRYLNYSHSSGGNGPWGALCASFEGGHVRSTDSFVAHNGSLNSSDERIKKEISDINDASALEMLRLIQPKTYKYIDEEKMGSDMVYGFIAQQVQEVLPYATKTLSEYLPSIREMINVTQSNVVTFTNFNTNDLLSNTTIIQAQLFKGENKDLTISEIIDEHSIRVEEDLTEMLHEDETRLYIYGELVDDFLFLKKESIFTVATAALQEVDRQLQAEKAKVATLETQLASVLTRLDALENA